jgi:hypothetical protein
MHNANPVAELTQLVETIGFEAAEGYLRVHRRTLSRWLKGESRVPASALVTLRAVAFGQMPGRKREQAWNGWYFADGKLWSPEDVWFEPGDLRALPYLRGELRALRAQVTSLEAALKAAQHAGEVLYPAANEADGAQALVRDQIAAAWP